jgi:inner membrane protein
MDTLTHIVLGACIGEAVAGKQLGKKALIIGAVAQSLPDIDFVASFWLPTSTDLLAHRGITHSFFFALIVTPLLAWLFSSTGKDGNISFRRWTVFWGFEILIHIFIDAFNVYGTGWFEPFSHYRVSFNTMYVADPLFTVWPAMASIALLVLNRSSTKRKLWAGIGVWISAAYLLLGVLFGLYINTKVKTDLDNRKISFKRFFVTPTPLNNLLWYVVAETDSGYNIGYRSVFDKATETNLHFVFRNDSLLKLSDNKEDIGHLVQFSQGYYSADMRHDTLLFNDLRFGEILGWAEPNSGFVFYYYLQYPSENKMIVQRGRFAKWNKDALLVFLKRIRGI